MQSFDVPLSLDTLRWLAQGQWPSRLERAVRLWELLHRLYHPETPWRDQLKEVFDYTEVRELMFAAQHPRQDPAQGQAIYCPDPNCLCHRPLQSWITDPGWIQELGLSPADRDRQLLNPPFGRSHRTLRKDLTHLAEQGWLQKVGRGQFRCSGSGHWPSLPTTGLAQPQWFHLGPILADIAFIHPELAVVLSDLWGAEIAESLPARRLFIQMDYILSDEQHQQVDDYHEQLERSWGRMIQFEYNTREAGILSMVTYPVCLHYVRRAKYLSAYGQTPAGEIGWHNFRLDRICSRRLTSLDWQDERIPQPLQALYLDDCLPSPEVVQEELEEAWGFNFYLPKALLLLRFSPEFAQRYVDNTQRHPTFRPISHQGIPALIQKHVQDPKEQAQLLDLVAQRPATDCYFTAWIRLGDTNLTMRLRDWRPNGEILAPLVLRQQMKQEAQQELSWYQ